MQTPEVREALDRWQPSFAAAEDRNSEAVDRVGDQVLVAAVLRGG